MKQFKLMILVNVFLSLLFVSFNFIYSSLATGGHNAVWSPLWLTFYNALAAATFGDLGLREPNFSFYFFWISTITNVYFIFRLKEAKKQGGTLL
jgi:hypothetical protein